MNVCFPPRGNGRIPTLSGRPATLIRWVMNGWFVLPFVGAFITYAGATYWASRLLPSERRRLGDTRPVPDLLDPLASHRWLPILLWEKTRGFRPPARRAFAVARVALLLTPVAFFGGMAIAANFPEAEEGGNADIRDTPPPVTLAITD